MYLNQELFFNTNLSRTKKYLEKHYYDELKEFGQDDCRRMHGVLLINFSLYQNHIKRSRIELIEDSVNMLRILCDSYGKANGYKIDTVFEFFCLNNLNDFKLSKENDHILMRIPYVAKKGFLPFLINQLPGQLILAIDTDEYHTEYNDD